MKNTFQICALAMLSATALIGVGAAQAPSAPNSNPAAVQPGEYSVEPMHTRIGFAVSHLGFGDWFGDLTGASGSLTLNPTKPGASHVEIEIPMASISTTNTKLDGELRSADWFDAARFPTIHFVSTRVTRHGADAATIEGDLTLHGVTRRVALDTHFNAAGINPIDKAYTAGFRATTMIRRSDYGVKTYLPLIGDDVQVRITAAFVRKLS